MLQKTLINFLNWRYNILYINCLFFTKLNKLDANTKNKTYFKIIEYYYYSKKLSESKDEKENDNNGNKLIKKFIKNMYYTHGKEFNKKDNQINIKNELYKTNNENEAYTATDVIDDSLSVFAPPPK